LEKDYLAIAIAPTPDSMDRRLVEVPSGFFFWQVEMDPSVFAFVWEALLEGARRGFRVFVSQRHAAVPKAESSGRGKGSPFEDGIGSDMIDMTGDRV